MDSIKNVIVLISTYNGETYIEQQIDSVLNQNTKHNVFIYIRDDGSVDNTVSIIKKYEERYEKIRCSYGENLGVVGSYFNMLKSCDQYDYYAFCDQDDYWLDDKIETAINMLELNDYGGPLLYAAPSYIADHKLNNTGKVTHKKNKELNFYNTAIQNICPGHNQVINKEMVDIINERDVDTAYVYSQDLWVTNVAINFGKIVFDNTPHTLYRMHDNNKLGFGIGNVDYFNQRIYRINEKEGAKFSIQLKYFSDFYNELISADKIEEVNSFINSQYDILKRLKYAVNTQFWRQSVFENIIYRLLYVLGVYNIERKG